MEDHELHGTSGSLKQKCLLCHEETDTLVCFSCIGKFGKEVLATAHSMKSYPADSTYIFPHMEHSKAYDEGRSNELKCDNTDYELLKRHAGKNLKYICINDEWYEKKK